MTTPTQIPVGFEIQRIGQKPERITADTVETVGTPPKYVFSRKDAFVCDIVVHALEREPKPVWPRTPEEKAAWKAFVRRQDAVNQVSHLQR